MTAKRPAARDREPGGHPRLGKGLSRPVVAGDQGGEPAQRGAREVQDQRAIV
jgi:hypothetical protein